MSRFTVNLNSPEPEAAKPSANSPVIAPAAEQKKPKKRGLFVKILGVLGILIVLVLLIGGIGSYFYWQSVKKTPQYSLALLVDAARRDDKAQIDKIIDDDAVVNSFLPQISSKAIELYGRNLPPKTLERVQQIAEPLMPAIRDRAKAELPRLIREKTQPVEKIPYWLIALGADRAVDIQQNGDTAQVKSKMPTQSLELTMKRDGDTWRVVAIKDDVLSRRIAEAVGQQIIALAAKGTINQASRQLGVNNLQDMIKQLENVFK